jgi:hypothetical protein
MENGDETRRVKPSGKSVNGRVGTSMGRVLRKVGWQEKDAEIKWNEVADFQRLSQEGDRA